MQIKQNKTVILALGTGTSTGIPTVGCHCKVCSSENPKDKRLRTSLFISTLSGKKFLVDTTPDLRTQLLAHQIEKLDFAIITHDHADHLHGIDDLRPLSFKTGKSIPLYLNEKTKASIEKRFSYIFPRPGEPSLGGGIPKISLHKVELNTNLIIENEPFYFFNYPHGYGETMGFIHRSFAYIVDCFELPLPLLEFLKAQNLQCLIIDCLKRGTHGTHLSVEKCFEYIKTIGPQMTGLIHMGHDLSHQELTEMANSSFPKGSVFPLFDGQALEISDR